MELAAAWVARMMRSSPTAAVVADRISEPAELLAHPAAARAALVLAVARAAVAAETSPRAREAPEARDQLPVRPIPITAEAAAGLGAWVLPSAVLEGHLVIRPMVAAGAAGLRQLARQAQQLKAVVLAVPVPVRVPTAQQILGAVVEAGEAAVHKPAAMERRATPSSPSTPKPTRHRIPLRRRTASPIFTRWSGAVEAVAETTVCSPAVPAVAAVVLSMAPLSAMAAM
jgi:hypothetical protein